jgi:hypothetical protein
VVDLVVMVQDQEVVQGVIVHQDMAQVHYKDQHKN